MGRLRALLHAQQVNATRNATAQQPLLRVAHPSKRNTQQPGGDLAISEKKEELTALVNRVADHNGFTPEQRREALEIALADHVAALGCFRLLAAGIPMPERAKDKGK